MHVTDLIKKRNPSFSFEFFPPKTEKGWNNLLETIKELKPLKPAYVSVTYGAGGTNREKTHQVVEEVQLHSEIETVAHLTCVGSTRNEIREILRSYQEMGVKNILALKGDLPKENNQDLSEFNHAADLITFIKKEFPDFCVGAACFPEGHPACPNRMQEMDYLKQKVDAGTDYLVTQLYFDNRDFYDFKERAEHSGIHLPVIAGIMPVTSKKSMFRMAELAGGARFPASLLKLVDRAENDDYLSKSGIHWAVSQINDLIDNQVDGIHLYTLNNARTTVDICHALGLSSLDMPR